MHKNFANNSQLPKKVNGAHAALAGLIIDKNFLADNS
jgi:hypothetical protein